MNSQLAESPSEQDAITAVMTGLDHTVLAIERFPTGNQHFVYDVYTDENKWVAVRLANSKNRDLLAGAIYWSNLLRPKGIPLPEILYADLDAKTTPFPCLILERFPGTDLGHVYDQLSRHQKEKLAQKIVEMQQIMAQLPEASGFGYLTSYEEKPKCTSWKSVVEESFQRSRARLEKSKVVPLSFVDEAAALIPSFEDYFATIKPVPFLDDVTTKNVIMNEGALSGIVDVDAPCFGDPLLNLALTRTALWSEKKKLDYIEIWTELLHLSSTQKRALDFYTLQCTVDFISECGQAFNRAQAESIDHKRLAQLKAMHGELIKKLS